MDCSMPGFPVLHCLPEFAQAQVHWDDDSIQPSHLCHPLLILPSVFPSFSVFSNESTLHVRWPKYGTSALVLPMNIQGWFLLGLTGLISLLSKELSIVFFRTVWKYQLFGPQLSLWSNAQNTLRMPLRLRIPGFKSCTTQFHGWPTPLSLQSSCLCSTTVRTNCLSPPLPFQPWSMLPLSLTWILK